MVSCNLLLFFFVISFVSKKQNKAKQQPKKYRLTNSVLHSFYNHLPRYLLSFAGCRRSRNLVVDNRNRMMMKQFCLTILLLIHINVIGLHSFLIPTTTTTPPIPTTIPTLHRNSILGPIVVQPARTGSSRTNNRGLLNDDIDVVHHSTRGCFRQSTDGSIFRTSGTTGSSSFSQGMIKIYSDRMMTSLLLLRSASAINQSESDRNSSRSRTTDISINDIKSRLLTVRNASMILITTYYKVVLEWITKYFTVVRKVYNDFSSTRNKQLLYSKMISLRKLLLKTIASIVQRIQTIAIFIQTTIVTYTSTIIIVLISSLVKLQEQIINNTRKVGSTALVVTKKTFSNGVNAVHHPMHTTSTANMAKSNDNSTETNIELTPISSSSIVDDIVTIPSLSFKTKHDSTIIDTTPTLVSTLSTSRNSIHDKHDDNNNNNNNNNNDVVLDQGSVTVVDTTKSRIGNFLKKNTSFLYDSTNGSTEVTNESNTQNIIEPGTTKITTISKSLKQTATSFLSFGSSNSNNDNSNKRKLLLYRNQQPKSIQEETLLQAKYAAIPTLEERAFQILVDLGMVEIHHHHNPIDNTNNNVVSGKVVPIVLDNSTGEWE